MFLKTLALYPGFVPSVVIFGKWISQSYYFGYWYYNNMGRPLFKFWYGILMSSICHFTEMSNARMSQRWSILKRKELWRIFIYKNVLKPTIILSHFFEVFPPAPLPISWNVHNRLLGSDLSPLSFEWGTSMINVWCSSEEAGPQRKDSEGVSETQSCEPPTPQPGEAWGRDEEYEVERQSGFSGESCCAPESLPLPGLGVICVLTGNILGDGPAPAQMNLGYERSTQ